MPSKGFNSILFDIDSLIDLELSYLIYLQNNYKYLGMSNFDLDRIINLDIKKCEIERMLGVKDLFRSFLTKDDLVNSEYDILSLLVERDYTDIINKYSHFTNMKKLISAYRKAGDGTIKTAVWCEDYVQAGLIRSILPNTTIEGAFTRDSVDMGKYTRLISGNYKHILEYKFKEPKSIVVVNFRENFTEENINILRPELVISLGDIHDIQVVPAYNNDFKIDG